MVSGLDSPFELQAVRIAAAIVRTNRIRRNFSLEPAMPEPDIDRQFMTNAAGIVHEGRTGRRNRLMLGLGELKMR